MSVFSKILDLPPGLISLEPSIELIGNKQLSIEGAKGILEYGRELISISCGKYAVTVAGQGLELKNMSPHSCTITGFFQSLSFEM